MQIDTLQTKSGETEVESDKERDRLVNLIRELQAQADDLRKKYSNEV